MAVRGGQVVEHRQRLRKGGRQGHYANGGKRPAGEASCSLSLAA
jgi:hypothetical protein